MLKLIVGNAANFLKVLIELLLEELELEFVFFAKGNWGKFLLKWLRDP